MSWTFREFFVRTLLLVISVCGFAALLAVGWAWRQFVFGITPDHAAWFFYGMVFFWAGMVIAYWFDWRKGKSRTPWF